MNEIIVLWGGELQALMTFSDYVDAIAKGFRMFAEGRAASPLPLYIPAQHGAFTSRPPRSRWRAIKSAQPRDKRHSGSVKDEPLNGI